METDYYNGAKRSFLKINMTIEFMFVETWKWHEIIAVESRDAILDESSTYVQQL